MGKVRVRIRTSPDGKVNYTIIGHSEGSTCHNTSGEALINKMSTQNIPGYGGAVEELDGGKTQEFYDTKKVRTVAPIPGKPKNTFDEEPEEEQQKRQDMSLGFGT